MEPPKMGEGVLGLSLGGDQGFSSAFSALAGAASAARTVRDTRARGAMDTERELMALPEKDDLRAPATFIAGATRAVDIVKDAIMLATLLGCGVRGGCGNTGSRATQSLQETNPSQKQKRAILRRGRDADRLESVRAILYGERLGWHKTHFREIETNHESTSKSSSR